MDKVIDDIYEEVIVWVCNLVKEVMLNYLYFYGGLVVG